MAIVRVLEKVDLEREVRHTEVSATYSLIRNSDGEKFLQIDTYGSPRRQEKGKKSQSIRFSEEAIAQLKELLSIY